MSNFLRMSNALIEHLRTEDVPKLGFKYLFLLLCNLYVFAIEDKLQQFIMA